MRRVVAYVVVIGTLLGLLVLTQVQNRDRVSEAADVAMVAKRLACLQGNQTAGASHVRLAGAEGSIETIPHWRTRLINQRESLIFAALEGGCGDAFVGRAESAVVEIEQILAAIATHPTHGPISRIMHQVKRRAEAAEPK